MASTSISLVDLPGEVGEAVEAAPSTTFLVERKPLEGELDRECVLLRALLLLRLLLFVSPAMSNPNPWMIAAIESMRLQPLAD